MELILTMNEKTTLECAGSVSHELAVKKAEQKYSKYIEFPRYIECLSSIKELDKDIKRNYLIRKR